MAQSTPVESVSHYQIPSGPLAPALNQFAATAGIYLSSSVELTQNKSSMGLHGEYSVAGGLAELLRGTGLQAVPAGGRNYNLRLLAQSQTDPGVRELDGVTVVAMQSLAAESASNYTVSRSSSASKLDLALKETPQSVTVFTEKLMQDMNANNVDEVLNYTPGVTVIENGVPGAGRVQYFSRGFAVNSFQIDGLMVDGAAFGAQNNASNRTAIGFQDAFLYERLDIIRGSTGLTSGQGDPSASLSFIRKRPLPERKIALNLKYGSWDNKRGEFDFSTPMNESGTLRTRLVATRQDGNSYIERVKQRGDAVYGIIEFDPAPSTTISVGGTRLTRHLDGAGPHGISRVTGYWDYNKNPSYNVYNADELGRDFNNATQWSYRDFSYTNLFATLDHTFDNDWQFNASFNRFGAKSDRFYGVMGSQFYLPEYDVASYVFHREKYENRNYSYDVSLKGNFQLLGRQHDFVVGANQTRSNRTGHSFRQSPGPGWPTLPDIDDPQYDYYWKTGQWIRPSQWNNGDIGLPPIPESAQKAFGFTDWNTPGFTGTSKKNQKGVYASLRLRPLERLQVILGGRWGKGEEGYAQPSSFLPYGGLIYELTPSINVYGGYARVEKPNEPASGRPVTLEGDWLKPLKANTIEAGIKAGLFDNSLNLAATYFTMTQDNFPIQTEKWVEDPDYPGNYGRAWTGVDGYRIYGVELSAAGQITPNWSVMTGYVWQRQRIPFDINNPPDGVQIDEFDESFFFPKNAVKLFTTYDFLERYTVGGGVTWHSGGLTSIRANSPDAGRRGFLSQGSYAIYNLMARYRFSDHVTLGVNVNNVFDKWYFTNSSTGNYGPPRNVTASLSLAF